MGPSGAVVLPQNAKNFADIVKSGDIIRVNQECHARIQAQSGEARDVLSDAASFSQNLIFSASAIVDEDTSITMMTILIESGVDVHQKDALKQTPLYYAARDGKPKVI